METVTLSMNPLGKYWMKKLVTVQKDLATWFLPLWVNSHMS